MQRIVAIVILVLVLLPAAYYYFQINRVDNFDLAQTTFAPSEYQAAPTTLVDRENIAHAQPKVVAFNDFTLSWIKRTDTMIGRSVDGTVWQTERVPSGVQTATSPTQFGLVEGGESRLLMVQSDANGVYGAYFDASSDRWSESVPIARNQCRYSGCRDISLVYDDADGITYGTFLQAHHQQPQGIYFFSSNDNGTSWSSARLISNITYTNPVDVPVLSFADGTLYISYSHQLISSADGGVVWQSENSAYKSMAVSNVQTFENDTAVAVWSQQEITEKNRSLLQGGTISGNEYVLFSRFNNGVWQQPVILNDTSLTFTDESLGINDSFTEYLRERSNVLSALDFIDYTVSTDGALIGVVWEDSRNGYAELFFTYSADGGETWHENIPVNTFGQNVLRGTIEVVNEDEFLVAFVSFTPDFENRIAIPPPTSLYTTLLKKL